MDSSRRRRTFAEFQQQLRESKTVDDRLAATRELHQELRGSHPTEVLAFGQELQRAILEHDKGDSLATAHAEGRAIFRSWHKAGAVDEAAPKTNPGQFVFPRVGFDALNVLLDPGAFRNHKDAYKAGSAPAGPTIETPSTLLRAGEKEPTLFADENGTATALLPEAHYAAFFAFNEVAKDMQRGHKAASASIDEVAEQAPGRHEVEALAEHARFMRASVTRPVFFDSDDIGSYTHAIADSDPKKPHHVRKGHFTLLEDPTLNMSFEEKLEDKRRVNALFYQSFSNKGEQSSFEWNEMVVKFRATGHTAPINEQMSEMVPAMQGRTALEIRTYVPKGNPDRSSTQLLEPIRAKPVDAKARKSGRKG